MFDHPTRRQFMKRSGAVALGAAGLGALDPRELLAANTPGAGEPPTLVVLYLRGGADPINAIVPFADPLYKEVRPTLAVPTPGEVSEPDRCVIPVDDYFGFHPAMRPLAELYEAGTMIPILNAGSTHPTRSHFDAQDFMERAAPGIKSITEGWLNRYLEMTKTDDDRDLRALSLQPTLPRSLRGQYSVLAVPDYGADEAMRAFERLYGCDSNKEAIAKNEGAPAAGPSTTPATAPTQGDLARQRITETGREGIAKLQHLNGVLRRAGDTRAKYPDSYLGRQFRDLAKVIKAGEGLEIAAIDYNGWDHHAYQGGFDGTHADMLANISGSIRAFSDDLGPTRMGKTLVLCMSEFGRTVRENGNNGTDHGHGGFMFAVGGMVNGGKFYGGWTGMARADLYQGRDLPVSPNADFRNVFAESLQALFGFRTDRHDFFPGYQANKKALGFLSPVAQA